VGDRVTDLFNSGHHSDFQASANEGTASDLGISFFAGLIYAKHHPDRARQRGRQHSKEGWRNLCQAIVFNLSAWVWAWLGFRHYPTLVGTAFLPIALVFDTRWMPTISQRLNVTGS
jgi:hypothetical protein